MLRQSILFMLWVMCFDVVTYFALAQLLHTWQSKDGHTTEAAFLEFDEIKGTVTILVPKVVPIDKLSAESVLLVKNLAGQVTGNVTQETSIPEKLPTTSKTNSNKLYKAGSPVRYEPFDVKKWDAKGVSTELVPWEGQRVVLLTLSNKHNPAVMKRILQRLDAGWETYEKLVGRSPNPFKQIDGKPTIAAVPDAGLTCGYGCGYIGATGVEVAGFYNTDYPLVQSNPQAFSHYYFYELGRNFYVFEDRHSLYITGYAVFMRYVCMDALKCKDPDDKTRATIEACEQAYAESNLSFLKAFTNFEDNLNEKSQRLTDRAGKPISPSDQPVIYAAAMLKLRKDYGGDEWLKRFFQHLQECPKVKADSRETAIKQSLNWLVSASAAAKKDLTPVFVDRWRMPLGKATVTHLAKVDWKDKDLDVAAVLAAVPFEMQ